MGIYHLCSRRMDNRKGVFYICITVFILVLLHRHLRHQQVRMAHARADGSPNSVEFDIGMTRDVHITDFVDDLVHFKSRIYTQVEHTKLFVYAAIARNISTPWDEFGVTAWIHSGVDPKNASCCFLYIDGVLRITNAWRYSVFMKPEIYVIRFQCANPIPGSKPIRMTLAVSGFACSSNITTYVKPLYPLRPHGNVTIAICTKQAYGNLDPNLVVEWLEYNINMGVDKVITFVDASNLIQNTSEILRYYQKIGFIEIIPYDLPMRDVIPRIPGAKITISYSDSLAAIHYCEDQLAGYSFVAVADFDEFIFPRKHANIKQLMVYLSEIYPDVGVFTFKTEIYITSWGKINENGHLILTQYSNRTEAIMDRVKNMLIPQRIQPGAVTTHTAKPSSGYRRTVIPSDLAVINHYRKCIPKWTKDCFNFTDFPRITDFSMSKRLSQVMINKISLYNQILLSKKLWHLKD
ncbi:hypothetical protein CHS0354_030888 [Potamilus streckersoni]|uniref:Glycosyltransferase family 92 protein n=1 Tax=Potamilus streckersoni TaxID=2493646 RepID=A0AAE0SB04_9BIVA|nr:hypothetical protein CHS0354_030888 [Potamilus streckersoni]